MADRSNIAVINEIYEAFGRGDIVAILDRIDDGAELLFEGPSTIPWAGRRNGRDGWTAFFQTVGQHLDSVTLNMAPFAADGDNVVFAGRYQARVIRTGKRIDSPLLHLWTLRGGKIVRCQEGTNTAAEVEACT